ncbi:MAG: ATP-dependent DNA ligase [Dehalococcoidia bacterium]
MNEPLRPPITPTEAQVADALPTSSGWAFEPKWDGFRVLGWSEPVRLDSRNGKALLRYFPELEPALNSLPRATVVDGEVLVVVGDRSDFDALQARIHPAASRIAKLSVEIPATLVAFDLLALEGEDLRPLPFAERRARLQSIETPGWRITPSTDDLDEARRWFEEFESAGCDGIVAKRLDLAYRDGRRDMIKVKHRRTADVVVGGYRVGKNGGLGALLLGMYDEAGLLHFVGHCSSFSTSDRTLLLEQFAQVKADSSFSDGARRPEIENRWSYNRETSWTPVVPGIVMEVSYDQVTDRRFRHATRFLRWRDDKEPRACTLDQLDRIDGLGVSSVLSNA